LRLELGVLVRVRRLVVRVMLRVRVLVRVRVRVLVLMLVLMLVLVLDGEGHRVKEGARGEVGVWAGGRLRLGIR
jgi:hypothetical protein